MSGKIIIDSEKCKGCGLCITVCPNDALEISAKSNNNGRFPAQKNDSPCSGCISCAIICPEAVIEVSRGSNIMEIKPAKKSSKLLIKEKK